MLTAFTVALSVALHLRAKKSMLGRLEKLESDPAGQHSASRQKMIAALKTHLSE
jgi:hypothetical protein